MALVTVNERSTMALTAAFTDENGAATTPSAATYRIDDLTTSAVILDATSIGSLSTSVTIEITPEQNKILRPEHLIEERVVTVSWSYGASKAGTQEYVYRVKNLTGVS